MSEHKKELDINREKNKRTQGMSKQLKKHYTMFNAKDKEKLVRMLDKINKVDRSKHLKEKIETKGILFNMEDVKETLKSGNLIENVIEYNETITYRSRVNKKQKSKVRIEQRILLRLNKIYEFENKNKKRIKYRCFVVINLTTNEIMTVYYNTLDDKHKINPLNYCRYMKVREYLKGGYNIKTLQKGALNKEIIKQGDERDKFFKGKLK